VRVLHVVASGKRRGAETFASDLVRSLRKAKVQQRVVVLRGRNGSAVSYEVPAKLLGLDGGRLGRLNPQPVGSLRGSLDSWKPDVIQAHGGEALIYSLAASVGRAAGLVVYRRIGSAHPRVAGTMRRRLYGGLMRRAAAIVAVSEAVRRDTVTAFGVPASRVLTIPNGVDPARFTPTKAREATRHALGIPMETPLCLSVGAFTWEKDPHSQLAVIERVLHERPEAFFLMAGDGPLRGEVDAVVHRKALESRVRTLGSRSDVPDLMAASDVLLLASRTEGMPACVIEAGLAGLAVSAYAVAGVPEVVIDGESGLLAPPGDVDGLARRVVDILENDSARRAMGRAARARCLRSFVIERIAPRYLRLYEEMVAA
jgi:glycosyltransferase involved in cell wall biosynthesis